MGVIHTNKDDNASGQGKLENDNNHASKEIYSFNDEIDVIQTNEDDNASVQETLAQLDKIKKKSGKSSSKQHVDSP